MCLKAAPPVAALLRSAQRGGKTTSKGHDVVQRAEELLRRAANLRAVDAVNDSHTGINLRSPQAAEARQKPRLEYLDRRSSALRSHQTQQLPA